LSRQPCKDGTLAHHFVYPAQQGAYVVGTCKKCSFQKTTQSFLTLEIAGNWKTVQSIKTKKRRQRLAGKEAEGLS
jgi:hypothetical protein